MLRRTRTTSSTDARRRGGPAGRGRVAAANLLTGWLCAGLLLAAAPLRAQEGAGDVELAALRLAGQSPVRLAGLKRLAWEVQRRTSVQLALAPRVIGAEELLAHPLLVLVGDRAFAPWPRPALRDLARHLNEGGFLWIDNAEGVADGGFDRSVRALVAELFPGQVLRPLPGEHVIHRSFYLVDRFAGRVLLRPYLEGVLLGERVALVYTSNDLSGAFEQDEFGNWTQRVEGGERQRELAFRLGVNLVLYALCLDYKNDAVHLPFILQRRR